MGGEGVISVMANALPKTFCKMINAALDNHWDVARLLHNALVYLDDPLYVEGNPVGVKNHATALGKMQRCVSVAFSAHERKRKTTFDRYH